MEQEKNLKATGRNSLSDESRVKVLSPSMLVLKRFMRNKLAITGLIILVVMFAFAFIGGIVSPYEQDQVFKKYEYTSGEYAGATINNELRYVTEEGSSFSRAAYAQLVKAINSGETTFSAENVNYSMQDLGNGTYVVNELANVASVSGKVAPFKFTAEGSMEITEGLENAFTEAAAAKETSFEYEGAVYSIVAKDKLTRYISAAVPSAVASMNIFDPYAAEDADFINSFAFRLAAEKALAEGSEGFEVDGAAFTISGDDDSAIVFKDGSEFAGITDLIVNAISPDVFVTVEFKQAFQDAIDAGASEFTMVDDEGNETRYSFHRVASQYTISTDTLTMLNDTYAYPSKAHPMGTDSNGMDVLTRLMYGGRISLMVGFVVVIIELIIGIVFGGISGYFGGWVDTLLMRFVDLFNCIPYWPIMIITGSVMDTLEIDSIARIFLLMFIMGLMSWTGIARVVRGQILTLREQDFMIATEATGIRVSRRIFRHLVPNVMPLLIVQATMSLGSIIITEATLSFLGLGVKYPLASWGSIINAATDIYVMKAYPFIWIPAGLLILLTVLGFNFMGDGLRDAFDPKMKR
jgi:peptide/nickel transport system permease protein